MHFDRQGITFKILARDFMLFINEKENLERYGFIYKFVLEEYL